MGIKKWLDDFCDEQQADGSLPCIIPTSRWGYHWGNGAPFDAACVLIPWLVYRYRGNVEILKDNYTMMSRYAEYLITRENSGLMDWGLGDWARNRIQKRRPCW